MTSQNIAYVVEQRIELGVGTFWFERARFAQHRETVEQMLEMCHKAAELDVLRYGGSYRIRLVTDSVIFESPEQNKES